MRFVPVKSSGVACSNSGIWRKTGQTGRMYTDYGSGDTGTGTRYLGARIDDDYYPSNGYTSIGWWNADAVYNKSSILQKSYTKYHNLNNCCISGEYVP